MAEGDIKHLFYDIGLKIENLPFYNNDYYWAKQDEYRLWSTDEKYQYMERAIIPFINMTDYEEGYTGLVELGG